MKSSSSSIFVKRFRELYDKDGYTQPKFAKVAKISTSQVSNYYAGNNTPSLENLDKIAAVWGYTAAEFIAPEELPEPRIERATIAEEVKQVIQEQVHAALKIGGKELSRVKRDLVDAILRTDDSKLTEVSPTIELLLAPTPGGGETIETDKKAK